MIKSLKNEIWLPIVGYEGLYEISNIGRVKSLARLVEMSNGRSIRHLVEKLKGIHSNRGYRCVELSIKGFNKKFQVHRLIMIAFIGYKEGKPQVNHINGIRHDNRVENLEWCTASENIQHTFRVLGRKGIGQKGVNNHFYGKGDIKKSCKKISCDTLGITFCSIRKAARELGLNNANIVSSLRGRCLHTEGLTFRYIS